MSQWAAISTIVAMFILRSTHWFAVNVVRILLSLLKSRCFCHHFTWQIACGSVNDSWIHWIINIIRFIPAVVRMSHIEIISWYPFWDEFRDCFVWVSCLTSGLLDAIIFIIVISTAIGRGMGGEVWNRCFSNVSKAKK